MLKERNIVLRPLQHSDLNFLEKIENNKENWQFGSEEKKFTNQQLLYYIANADTDIKIAKQYRFVVDLNKNPIGFIDLFDYTTNSAGIGVIISKDYRNKGFAKEALKLICIYAFNTLNLSKLHSTIKKYNLQSIRLFISCGFELEREEQESQKFVKFAKS